MITTIEKNGEKHPAIIFQSFPLYSEEDIQHLAKSVLSIFSFIFCCEDRIELIDLGALQDLLELYKSIIEGGES